MCRCAGCTQTDRSSQQHERSGQRSLENSEKRPSESDCIKDMEQKKQTFPNGAPSSLHRQLACTFSISRDIIQDKWWRWWWWYYHHQNDCWASIPVHLKRKWTTTLTILQMWLLRANTYSWKVFGYMYLRSTHLWFLLQAGSQPRWCLDTWDSGNPAHTFGGSTDNGRKRLKNTRNKMNRGQNEDWSYNSCKCGEEIRVCVFKVSTECLTSPISSAWTLDTP